jgi:hypothetical protein
MNYESVNTVDNKKLQKEIKQIDDNILIIDTQIKEITMKLNEIQNFTTVFQKKSNLYNNEENIELKMQISLLQNEKEHITHMKKIFITNLFNELYELSNNIILLISSFLNLEFNENINSSEILKKLVRIKQLTTIRMNDIYESVIAISKNLNLVYDTLHEFNDYIEGMGSNIKTNNYHCSNVYTSLKHKYSFIMLEYTKYYNTINNIIPFYYNLSLKINNELNNKSVLFHCLNNTELVNNNVVNNGDKTKRSSPLQSNSENPDNNILNNLLNNTSGESKTRTRSNSSSPSVVSFDLNEYSEDDVKYSNKQIKKLSSPNHSILKKTVSGSNSNSKLIVKEKTKKDNEKEELNINVNNDIHKINGDSKKEEKNVKSETPKTFRSVVNKVINSKHYKGKK